MKWTLAISKSHLPRPLSHRRGCEQALRTEGEPWTRGRPTALPAALSVQVGAIFDQLFLFSKKKKRRAGGWGGGEMCHKRDKEGSQSGPWSGGSWARQAERRMRTAAARARGSGRPADSPPSTPCLFKFFLKNPIILFFFKLEGKRVGEG